MNLDTRTPVEKAAPDLLGLVARLCLHLDNLFIHVDIGGTVRSDVRRARELMAKLEEEMKKESEACAQG